MVQKLSVQLIIFFFSLTIFSLLTISSSYAETTRYRSSNWIVTDGNPQYSNTTGCQESNDSLYCSRTNATGNAELFFGSFGDLEDFGIPLNSSIDKLHIRIKGKNTTTQYINVVNAYNKMPWSNSCQTPSDLWAFYLGPVENTIEKHTFTAGNGLTNCITPNNINFKNLTFRIASSPNPSWSADIDNFEVAFDYTPPSVTPTPADFPENQKGTVWEIGPDKSNIKNINGLDNVVAVASGTNHTLALKIDGTVWAWGSNQNGQLGNGSIGGTSEAPIQVKGFNGEGNLTDIKSIAAGAAHSIALKNDGTVWVWGQNSYGFLGVGVNDTFGNSMIASPMPAITSSGGIKLSDIIAVTAGNYHSIALKSDGSVYTWGVNDYGQLGIGCAGGNCSKGIYPAKIQINDIKGIAAGGYHSLAIKSDGSLWGWGRTDQGELGRFSVGNGGYIALIPFNLDILSGLKQVSVKDRYNLALTEDGKVYEWGIGRGTPRHISELTDIKSISAGWPIFSTGVNGHAVKQDGGLWQIYINDIAPKQVSVLENVTAVASGNQMPSVAIIGMATDVLGENTGPAPFLELPWDYKNERNIPGRKVRTFDEASMEINSFFDHRYPLQSKSKTYPEPLSEVSTLMTYLGTSGNGNLETCTNYCYSGHDGYDYGSAAGAFGGDPVKAAASGMATYKYTSAAGNLIYIDHLNGYQTRYYHLEDKGIFEGEAPGTKIDVVKGTEIGKVGSTGFYADGPHIHFSVYQDTDGDNDFEDEEPFGATDPFGWPNKSIMEDPWSNYTVTHAGQVYKGNTSRYLWGTSQAQNELFIGPNGGASTVSNAHINFHPNTVPSTIKVKIQSAPSVKTEIDGKRYKSIGHSFDVVAYDILGNLKDAFVEIFTITIDFTQLATYNVKPETLSVYSSKDRQTWVKEETSIDYDNGKAKAVVDHMTYFALIAEVADTQAPVTIAMINGSDVADKWFNDDVQVALEATDNSVGVDYTLYKISNEDWKFYDSPLNFTDIGEHAISFYSGDKGGNTEQVKSVEFHIDKTAPVTVASVSGVVGLDGWLVSDGVVSLSATDNGEVDRVEYSLDGGGTYVVYGEPFSVSDEGGKDVLYRSVDKAGNVEESKTVRLKIDKTAPESTVYTTGLFGNDGWYRSDVSVSFNASDSSSWFDKTFYSLDGENFVEYVDPLTIVDEGSTEITYYAVDKAGNKESQKTMTIKIDKTAPEAEITYDLSKFDVIVTGKDNFSTVKVKTDTSSKLNPKYTLTDLAGNTLLIATGELQIGKQVTQTLKTLKYNNKPSIALDRNIFFTLVFADRNNVVKQLDQYVSMKGDKRIFTNYASQTNITKIFTKNVGTAGYTRVDKQGIVLLKLYTEKGVVKYTY